jgi:branched-chain amino acid transport system permease protein
MLETTSQAADTAAAAKGPVRRVPPVRTLAVAAVPWVLLVIGISMPGLLSTTFELTRIQLLLSYITIALALNFAFGFAGELSLSQPVLVAVSAYTAGLLSAKWNWDFWQTAVPGVLAAIVTSVLIALPSLRVRGWYFAIISFFAIVVMPDVINAFAPVTGGDTGLSGINPIRIGTYILEPWIVYELVVATTAVTWIGVRNLVSSGWGGIIRAMRDHPVAARATGVNLNVTRAWVHALLGVPCGLVGVEYAHTQLFLSPSNFAFSMILVLIGGVFLGGAGTIWGPVLGVAVFEGISLWIGPFNKLNQLFLGAGVLIAALGFKGGIVATAERIHDRVRRRRGKPVRGSAGEDDVRFQRANVKLQPIEASGVGLGVVNVSKAFGGNQALWDVSLEVKGGRLLALIGPNGSGKTTLINLVNGFVQADSGSISLNGTKYRHIPPAQAARLGLGRTFQVPRLVDELTVAENIRLGLLGLRPQRVVSALIGWPGRRRTDRADLEHAREVCRFLGLPEEVIDTKGGELPLGLKRIVEIGRAVVAGARVICLDEPAAGLNETERKRLTEVLRALVEGGRAVLLVEHNTRFVLDVCDEIALLRDGVVVGHGTGARGREMDAPLREYVAAYDVS